MKMRKIDIRLISRYVTHFSICDSFPDTYILSYIRYIVYSHVKYTVVTDERVNDCK